MMSSTSSPAQKTLPPISWHPRRGNQNRPQPAAPPTIQGDHRSVLIVDGNPVASSVLETVLQADGFDVASQPGLRAALAELESDPPDAVLLDPTLPDSTGLDVIRQFRAALPTTTVLIVVSGARSEGAVVEALGLGADDYITKPFARREVLARLHKRLAR